MALSNPSDPNAVPQFATAEYAKPGGAQCGSCKSPLGPRYYRAGTTTVCESCVAKARDQIPVDSHAKYVRAVLFGVGGAIVGLILYSTFAIVTGLVIGYLALAVGF